VSFPAEAANAVAETNKNKTANPFALVGMKVSRTKHRLRSNRKITVGLLGNN
jgi:hypothetical protein